MTALIRDARMLKQSLLLPLKDRGPGLTAGNDAAVSEDNSNRVWTEPGAQGTSRLIDVLAKNMASLRPPEPIHRDSHEVQEREVSEAAPPAVISPEERDEILRRETESARQEGGERGYQEGYSAGLERGESEYREKLASLNALMETAARSLEQGIQGLEDEAVEVVYEAIGKILGTALLNRAGVMAIVKQVIGQAKERERLIIRVSRADFDMLNEYKVGLLEGAGLSNCELVADERVVLGGCLLEASGGNLDGRLEIQLQQLREVLLSARTKRSDSDPA